MPTVDENPIENPEAGLEQGQVEETQLRMVDSKRSQCDKTTVGECISAVEQFALESHFDGGATVHEVRAAMRATDKARRSLADGKTDPCQVILDMLSEMTPRRKHGA